MANHLQAEKRNRQRIKRTERNRRFRSEVRTYVKRVRTFVSEEKADEAKDALKLAIRHLDRAVTKGLLHRNTASRLISRISVSVNKLSNQA